MKTFREYIKENEEILNESVSVKVAKIIGKIIIGGFLTTVGFSTITHGLEYWQSQQIMETAEQRVEKQVEEGLQKEGPVYTDDIVKDASEYIGNEVEKELEKNSKGDYRIKRLYNGNLGDKLGLIISEGIYARVNNLLKYYKIARDLKMYKDGVPMENIEELLQKAEEQKQGAIKTLKKGIDTVKDPKVRNSAAELLRKKGTFMIDQGKEIKNRSKH